MAEIAGQKIFDFKSALQARMRVFAFLAIFFVLLAYTSFSAHAENPGDIRACTQNSDCVVKDIHNCCGYYPACVNTNAVIDIEAVNRECAKQNAGDVCGFPEVAGCACQNGSCVNIESGSSSEDVPQ